MRKQKLAAVTLFGKGLSLKSIAEVIGANNVIVSYWIRNIEKFIKNIVLAVAVQSSKELEVIEIDELWHYVQKNRKSYGYGLLTLVPKKSYCLSSWLSWHQNSKKAMKKSGFI